MDSSEQDIIVFNIPVIIAKINQINDQRLKNYNSIIENLPFDCGSQLCPLTTPHKSYKILSRISKELLLRLLHLFLIRACNTDIYRVY